MKTCVICNSLFQSRYSAKTCSDVCSKEQHKRKKKSYKEATKERWREYNKQYYQENKIQCRASSDRARLNYRKSLETNEYRRICLIVKSCASGAKQRNLEFAIVAEIVYIMLVSQNNKCALTGIEFDFKFSEDFRSNPFSPSIDRKDSKKGYTYDNIQIVCNMVNVAKNEYPQEFFDEMCRARMRVLNGS